MPDGVTSFLAVFANEASNSDALIAHGGGADRSIPGMVGADAAGPAGGALGGALGSAEGSDARHVWFVFVQIQTL